MEDKLPLCGGLIHPGLMSLDCGCHCPSCDDREWCEQEIFKAPELESEDDNNDK